MEQPHDLVARAFELSEVIAKLSLAKSDRTRMTLEWLHVIFSDLQDVTHGRSLRAAAGLNLYICLDALYSPKSLVRWFLFSTCISL